MLSPHAAEILFFLINKTFLWLHTCATTYLPNMCCIKFLFPFLAQTLVLLLSSKPRIVPSYRGVKVRACSHFSTMFLWHTFSRSAFQQWNKMLANVETCSVHVFPTNLNCETKLELFEREDSTKASPGILNRYQFKATLLFCQLFELWAPYRQK